MSKDARWDEMVIASTAYQERQDCGVKALALIADISYGRAWDLLSDKGRKPRDVTMTLHIKEVLAALGFTCERVNPYQGTSTTRYTPITVYRRCHTGVYWCITRDHGFAVIDGKVLDWTEGRRHRIRTIFKIERQAA